jgi:hypothetical protein
MDKLLKFLLTTVVFLIGVITSACQPRTTPPGPRMAAGVYMDVAYEFYHWEEGLNLMIWHDAASSSSCDSSGSIENRIHTVDCHAISRLGKRFDWRIETQDGITGKFFVNNELVDLGKGQLFLVSTAGEEIDIQQVKANLEDLGPDNEKIIEFGLGTPSINAFIEIHKAE